MSQEHIFSNHIEVEDSCENNTIHDEKTYNLEVYDALSKKDVFVFSGGGVLGISHVGAWARLKELALEGDIEIKPKIIIGTSIGSVVAAVIAAGADADWMREKLYKVDLTGFRDQSRCLIKNITDLIRYWGWYRGDVLEEWVEELLVELTGVDNITFKQLYDKTQIHLIVVYLNVDTEETIYANWKNRPGMIISKALRASCAIPVYFRPLFSDNNNPLVDGGTTNNYPINVYRDMSINLERVLGFKFVSGPDPKKRYFSLPTNNSNEEISNKVNNAYEYAFRLIDILHKQALEIHVDGKDWEVTVPINIGHYTSTSLDLTLDDSEWLFEQGKLSVDRWIKKRL